MKLGQDSSSSDCKYHEHPEVSLEFRSIRNRGERLCAQRNEPALATEEVGEFFGGKVWVSHLTGELDVMAIDIKVAKAKQGIAQKVHGIRNGAGYGGGFGEEVLRGAFGELMQDIGGCGP